MLTIWKPSPAGPASDYAIGLPETLRSNEGVRQIFHLLDDDRIDREWVVRNVLGGMSAGFGLRGSLGSERVMDCLLTGKQSFWMPIRL